MSGADASMLDRRIGLGLLTAYGVGVMVGAGIYVLVGLVAGAAGVWAPLAFLFAGIVALPSALSYAELASRMPEAAGEVAYVERGFSNTGIAIIVGLAVVVAGTVSAAAVLRGGVGYLTGFLPVDPSFAILIGGALLMAIALWGVFESLAIAAIFTVVEVIGLLLVAGAGFMAEPVEAWIAPPAPEWAGIAAAVTLCFFAFIGFEDIVNMAEEVRDPTRIMPRGVLLALVITALLYALVSLAAVRSVPQLALGASEQPLALVWERATGQPARFLSAIAVAAAVNGVLGQIVMASRVLLGLGRRAAWLSPLAVTHATRHTPARATLLVGSAVVLMALALPVSSLAEAASGVLLGIFCLVNLAAIFVKRLEPQAPFRAPVWVPYAGFALSLVALVLTLWGMT